MRPVHLCALLPALLLAACGQPAQQEPQDTGPAMPEEQSQTQRLELTCADFVSANQAAITERFGAENISAETLPGPEGESYLATIVYANDPARRLEIVFDAANARVASVSVDSPSSTWMGPGGVSIGALLPEVERANGGAFMLWGFGWDYGGWVSNWNGGQLAPRDGCMTRVRFDPDNDAAGAQGDSEFSSANPAMRATTPRVSEFGLAMTTL